MQLTCFLAPPGDGPSSAAGASADTGIQGRSCRISSHLLSTRCVPALPAPTHSCPKIISRTHKTKLVVCGSLGNTKKGVTSEWGELKRPVGEGDTPNPVRASCSPARGRGARTSGSFYSLSSSSPPWKHNPLFPITPICGMRDTRSHTKPPSWAKAREAPGCKGARKALGKRGAHVLPRPDLCLGQSTAGAPCILVDRTVLVGREGQGERLGPGMGHTWPDAHQL